jgi:predicted nucleotide-binding protein
MKEVATSLAKLSGIRKSLAAVASENTSRNRGAGEVKTRANFPPDLVQHYFTQARSHLATLRRLLPDLFDDFQEIGASPEMEMATQSGIPATFNFSRTQVEKLIRDLDQIFEIRANSELATPQVSKEHRVFISHGASQDWLLVQPFIEKDVLIPTLELAQEPNQGRTIIEKLVANAARCDSAVIVMTGDDLAMDQARVRENVMHEIGYFQGVFGRRSVILLHEEGVNIPSNLSGVAYIPFPNGNIQASFHVLQRELDSLYGS